VERLARSQHGVILTTQALAAGATVAWLKWQVEAGFLVRGDPRVLRLGDTAPTWESDALQVCLVRGPDTVLSFGTAAHIRGLDLGPWSEQRLEVSVPHSTGYRSSELVCVHSSRRLVSSDRCRWGRLPLTTVARTIVDVAGSGMLQPAQLGRLVDDAVLSNKTSVVLLQSILGRSGRGRSGIRAVEQALAPWLAGGVDSHAEAEVYRLLLRAGLPAPACQYEIRDGEVFVARVDFAWPRWRLVLEVDGFQYHDGPAKFVEDRHRANRLAALGWRVISTTLRELRTDPTALFAALWRVLDGA
jgi:hypothetical protein